MEDQIKEAQDQIDKELAALEEGAGNGKPARKANSGKSRAVKLLRKSC